MIKKTLKALILIKTFLNISLIIKKTLNQLIEKNLISLNIATQVQLNLTKRPHYLYCLYHSALLAKKLNIKKISVIEFGVAGGNGVLFIESYIEAIKNELGVEIDIYGFDLGSGLLKPNGHQDLPYWFNENLYKMDFEKLKKKLKKTKLLIGDVKHTINDFFKNYNPAPIAAIFNDLDYYSSTKNSFEIFNHDDKYYLPRIFLYFDDVEGTEKEMYGEFNGELLAIKEFNNENKNKKIALNQNLLTKQIKYKLKVYYFHNFNHKDYNKYIYKNEQIEVSSRLNIKE